MQHTYFLAPFLPIGIIIAASILLLIELFLLIYERIKS